MIDLKPEYQVKLSIQRYYISVDDILLKPADANVFIEKADGFGLFNNFPLERN